MAESNRENYAEYAKWKGWEGNPDQAVMGERYAAEMRRAWCTLGDNCYQARLS